MKKNRILKLIGIVILMATIAFVWLFLFENSTLKRKRAFVSNVNAFKKLESVFANSYVATQKSLNGEESLDSLSATLDVSVYSVDFYSDSKSQLIILRTEPYYNYSGYMYLSDVSRLIVC